VLQSYLHFELFEGHTFQFPLPLKLVITPQYNHSLDISREICSWEYVILLVTNKIFFSQVWHFNDLKNSLWHNPLQSKQPLLRTMVMRKESTNFV